MVSSTSISSEGSVRSFFKTVLPVAGDTTPIKQVREACGCPGRKVGSRKPASSKQAGGNNRPLMHLAILNRAAMRASGEGRHDDALFQLAQAERAARFAESPLHEAKVRNNMGIVYQVTGRTDQAADCFRTAADLVAGAAGRENVMYRNIRRNLDRLQGGDKAAAA